MIQILLILLQGGIDSSSQETDSGNSESQEESVTETECERMVLVEGEDLGESSSDTSIPGPSDRREKIASFLKDERERKMTPRLSAEAQHLSFMKEEVTLKRKMLEKMDAMDQELLKQSNKMAKTMESIATAMTGCMQIMQTMVQKQQQPYQYPPSSSSTMHFSSYKQQPYHCFPRQMTPRQINSRGADTETAREGESFLELL